MANATQTARLNGLIVRCKDDSRIYSEAAEAHTLHRDELLALSRRRSAYAETLSGLVRKTGSAPSQHGSMMAWTRRAIFDVRVKLMGEGHLGDSLQACAEQESRTAAGYKRALATKSKWPTEIDEILRSQYGEIEEAHARVRELRGSA